MDKTQFISDFEEKVKKDLRDFLLSKGAIDEHFPTCPDVEERWSGITREYLPDGMREFRDYPLVSLGWMMFIGMAMAYYWDTEWEKYSSHSDLYVKMRDLNGFDNMDDAIVEDILGYKGEEAERVRKIAQQSAARVYSILIHAPIEPGTEMALRCYIAALHELYLAGMAMELKALGYHMRPFDPSAN